MTGKKVRSPARRDVLVPRVKVWLEKDGEYVFGWGLAEILTAVAQTGSIKEAAVQVGKSYRYVWNRIKEAEESLGESLVEARVGGAGVQRSEITPLARNWLECFLELRERVRALVEEEFAAKFAVGPTTPRKRRSPSTS